MKYYLVKYENNTYALKQLEDCFAFFSIACKQLIDIKTDDPLYQDKKRILLNSIKPYSLLAANYYGYSSESVNPDISLFNKSDLKKLQDEIYLFNQFKSRQSVNQLIETLTNQLVKKPIFHQKPLKPELIADLKNLLQYHQFIPGSLLFQILKRKGWELDSIDESFPTTFLTRTLNCLDLTVYTYMGLIRTDIRTIGQLLEVIKNQKAILAKRIKMNHEQEILTKFYKYLKQADFEYNLTVSFKHNGKSLQFDYQSNGLDYDLLSKYFYEDLFNHDNHNLLKQSDAYFPLSITMVLLYLGYLDINDVIKDLDFLDQYFYSLKIIDKPHGLSKYYQDYLDSHVEFYEISKDTYQKLKKQQITDQTLKTAYFKRQDKIDRLIYQLEKHFYGQKDDDGNIEGYEISFDVIKKAISTLDCLGELIDMLLKLNDKFPDFVID
ncbi:hypothetical protein [uncultured Thomasclavelia sp.]|uniref:hypothetical protein n=1 Tax=uncultured Thomasclavelia sp. TaxID=3025759 RepID=UPI0025CD9CD2|nr:hypothetical protein [uncultured Thomasclavelia sp.]